MQEELKIKPSRSSRADHNLEQHRPALLWRPFGCFFEQREKTLGEMLHPLRLQTSYRCATINRCEASCRLAHVTLRFGSVTALTAELTAEHPPPIRCSYSPLLERTLRQNNNTFLPQTRILTLQLHCRQSGGLGGKREHS